jgi:hypothetical protein
LANQCEDDCGSCANPGSECSEPFTDCGTSGDICNPQHYCVAPAPRGCGADPHGCCFDEVWHEVDCIWVYLHFGSQAYDECSEAYCLEGYGCGVCAPVGPAAPASKIP